MFNHILAPMDGSALAECAVPYAMAVARAFDARVTLLRVVVPNRDAGLSQAIDPVEWQIYRAEAERYLHELAARFQNADLRADKVLLEGQAAERIVQFVQDHEVDLIVLSTHGQSGLSGWNVSSVVQKVILRAQTPVLIVRAHLSAADEVGEPRFRRVLVPLDGSQRAEYVLPLALTLAHSHESLLVLAHVVPRPQVARRGPLTPDETTLVDRLTELNRQAGGEYLKLLADRVSAQVETRLLVSDNAAATLHDLVSSEDIDLVLLCAHGRSGETQWPYGSTALNFIVNGTTPLLILQDIPEEQATDAPAGGVASVTKGL